MDIKKLKPGRRAKMFLMMGAILLAIGIVPLWLTTSFWPGASPTLFGMAFILLTPLGGLLLAIAIIIWLVDILQALR